MASVTLKRVNESFGNEAVINNVSIQIEKWSLALLGPSGCGKTTTLRLVTGIEEADSGGIYISDRLVNDLSSPDRNVAMVFQRHALYLHMSVFDNMAFPLKNRKVPKEDAMKRVKDAAGLRDSLQYVWNLCRSPHPWRSGCRSHRRIGCFVCARDVGSL